MNPVKLKAGGYEAVFMPDAGMNLISFRYKNIEIIDQSTRPLFDERMAGLGALIGPHFHMRKESRTLPIKEEHLFPFVQTAKAQGRKDPLSHGIARYAPWTYETDENSIKGTLSGKDQWNGVSLSELEGQGFTMYFTARLLEDGLSLHLSVASDTDSVVGLHYYFLIPNKPAYVLADVQKDWLDHHEKKPIPPDWGFDGKTLKFSLENEADYTFHPLINRTGGHIKALFPDYSLNIDYETGNAENSWQLYHPKNASYVCIEPLSAYDPKNPHLSVSKLDVKLSVSET